MSVGLFKMRIPAFPVEVVREALLNAWDRAQQAKDPRLIEALDLPGAYNQSLSPASPTEHTEQR